MGGGGYIDVRCLTVRGEKALQNSPPSMRTNKNGGWVASDQVDYWLTVDDWLTG